MTDLEHKWVGQKYTYEEWPDSRVIHGHTVRTPPKPPKEEVMNYGLPIDDQIFKIPDQEMVWTIHQKMTDLDKDGNMKVEPTDEEVAFVNKQWYYRKNGMWFFNEGYLEYITGTHWFYISYFKMLVRMSYKNNLGDVSYRRTLSLPSFIDSDRDRFLLWDEVERSTKCAGLNEIGNRRDGKSYRALCTEYVHATGNRNSNCVIQSKTDTDAINLLRKLVTSWTEMPAFFKPIDAGYSKPKSGINFDTPSSFSQKGQHKKKDALNSSITPFPSGVVQLDGQGVDRVYHDEIGKSVGVDVYKRWMVVYETLVDNAYILGKGLCTTTVEEVSKENVAQVKKLWDESHLDKVNSLGQTPTGLWQYLKPAYYGFSGEAEEDGEAVSFVNKHGYSNIEAAKKYLLKRREGLEGADLWAMIRKYAFNEQEAFRAVNKDPLFAVEKIFDQIDFNLTLPKGHVREGYFVGEMDDLDFRFIDQAGGRFKISWMPPEKERNLKAYSRGLKPNGASKGWFGTDPYDNDKTVSHKFSKAGIHGVRPFDPLDLTNSGGFFLEYIYRQKTAPLFYKDAISAYVFFGMESLIEREKYGLIRHMKNVGLSGYCYRTNKKDYTLNKTPSVVDGINTSGDIVREAMMSELATYIAEYIGKISAKVQKERFGIEEPKEDLMGRFPFNETLQQFTEFEPEKWTDYDGTVSSMLAVLAMADNKRKFTVKPNYTKPAGGSSSVRDIFK